ncbi:hypothetical protein ABFS83_05G031300 [Erythranthe nasuta]
MSSINGHNHSDFSEKMQRCQDYVHGLEQERSKIQVFQRELPLCLELVTQAIEACKQQLHGQLSECSEQTSSDVVPVLEEFIPIKRAFSSCHSDDEEEEQESKKLKNDDDVCNNDDSNNKKSDWLRSVQLWNNQTPDLSKEDSPRKVAVTEVKRNGGGGGAFHPFKKEKSTTATTVAVVAAPPQEGSMPPASTSSTAETGGGNKKEDKESQSQRKSRRCWSPELHRRFLQSLQQLGGSHLATPKQIRELMKVDGLTNDEVKSHLQKYRLHTRRPNNQSMQNNNNNQQAPQFVVVGGIWMQPEYAAPMAAATTTSGEAASGVANSTGIYAPVASLPPPFHHASKQRQHISDNDRGCSHSDGAVHSNSPATSSSTHTSTASPAIY